MGIRLSRLGWMTAALLAVSGTARTATLRVPSQYPKIYEALDAAAANDTVLVAPGTYGDITVRSPFGTVAALGFIVRPVVLRSEAGPAVTVLDLSGGEGLANYVAGIWMQYGSSGSVVVEGFRFTGHPPPPTDSNAVAARFSSDLRVEDCEFEVEDSLPPIGDHPRDGISLVYCQDSLVRGCTFVNCRHGVGSGSDRTTVEDCVFRRCQNTALGFGFEGTNTVRDCLFESNVGQHSGAIIDLRGTLERCVFLNNRGEGYGGAVSCGFAQVRECLFVGNSSAAGGGGISTGGGGPSTVELCAFVGNHLDPENLGGAAVRATSSSFLIFRNNVITGSWGAAAVGRGALATIIPSCNVYWENMDGDWSGFTPDSTDRVVDPEFCDPAARDYTVRTTSPCLPPNSLGCGLIGAYGEGCGIVSVAPESWGRVKAKFRDDAPTSEERSGR